jgi:hypothetical protein
MKITKQFFTIFTFILMLSSTGCKEKYPNLGEGLFAEFITTKDTVVIKLHYKKVPLTVSNFVGLAEGTHPMLTDSLKGKPYYNGTVFHRIINNFMIQGATQLLLGLETQDLNLVMNLTAV